MEEGADPVAACHALGHSEENEEVRRQRVQRSAADACARDSRFVCQACHLQLMPRALFPVSHEGPDHECTSRGESDAPKVGSWGVDEGQGLVVGKGKGKGREGGTCRSWQRAVAVCRAVSALKSVESRVKSRWSKQLSHR